MKLVPKLTVALVTGMFVVLAVNGYFRIEREVAVLQADRARDHALFGRALAAAAGGVWRTDGRLEALKVVAAANAYGGSVHPRWVEPGPGVNLHADPTSLEALQPGETLTRIEGAPVEDKRFTYSPVVVGPTRVGFIELSESLGAERRLKRAIIADTLTTTLTMVLVCAFVSMGLGVWMVGRPVRSLCAKARRIGEGNFEGPLDLPQKDEFGVLAAEVNAMCGQLIDAAARVERESSARVATLHQLRHADRLSTVGVLASEIAHELGSPLNVVLARARMIAVGEASIEEAVDYARAIADAADRMTRIIRQLLAFARRSPADRAPRDLRTLAADTCDLLRPLAEKKQVTVELQDANEGAVAEVDGDGIQQALTNLVVNAIHAMPNGGTIGVSTGHERRPPGDDHPGHYVVVRVRDEGVGIAAEHLAHIFEPFFTTKDRGEGTGLGLSVTHGIVEDHRGFIDVESAPAKGSMFAIHLPAMEPP